MSTIRPRPAPPPADAPDERTVLAKALLALFDHWGLSTEQMLGLLGLSPASRSLIPELRRGSRPLPAGRDVADRAALLLRIHKGLRLLFPRDAELRYGWVHRANRTLDGQRPLEVMLDDGLVGVARMARFVDHLRGQ